MILTAEQMFKFTERVLKSDEPLERLCDYFSSIAQDGYFSVTIDENRLASLVGQNRMRYWDDIVQRLEGLGYGVQYDQLEDEYRFSWEKKETDNS